MKNITFVGNKDCDKTPRRPKPTHCIAGITFIVLDNDLLYELGIDEGTWFQQEIFGDGILLKKHPFRTIDLQQKSEGDKPGGE